MNGQAYKIEIDRISKLIDEDKIIGMHDVSNEAYHRSGGISSSNLNDLLTYSESHMKYWIQNPVEPSKAMTVGTRLHSAILEPDKFNEIYIVAPTVDKRTKEGKAIYEAFMTEHQGKELISQAEYDQVMSMHDSVTNHPLFKELMSGSLIEKAFYWRDRDTDVLCKAKPDIINSKNKVHADLKKTTSCQLYKLKNSIKDFKYHMQSAFHIDGANLSMNKDLADATVYIFVEDEPPYGCLMINPTQADIQRGRDEYKQALARYKKCLETNIWPSYPTQIIEMDVFGLGGSNE